MNKPSWEDAPDWANWLAMDEGDEWFWYQYKPDPPELNKQEFPAVWGSAKGKWCSAKRYESVASLEKKPK